MVEQPVRSSASSVESDRETARQPAAAAFPPGAAAIVTGASSGIGRAVAAALGKCGVQVLMVGRDPARLEEAAHGAGAAEVLACDLATSAGLDALAAHIPAQLHVLAHAAGAHHLAPLAATEDAALDMLHAINLRVPQQLTRLCLPALRAAQGQIVFMNSSQGLVAGRNVGGYAATKHALKALADSLRQEVNAEGIRVLSVYPGRTATAMQAAVHGSEGRAYAPETLMQPEDVAAMVLAALLLPRSAEVTDIMMRPMRQG